MVPHWYIFAGSDVGMRMSMRGRQTASVRASSSYAFRSASIVSSIVRTDAMSSLFRMRVMFRVRYLAAAAAYLARCGSRLSRMGEYMVAAPWRVEVST